jgi:uncharacterized integral membrane protein
VVSLHKIIFYHALYYLAALDFAAGRYPLNFTAVINTNTPLVLSLSLSLSLSLFSLSQDDQMERTHCFQ